MNTEVYMDICEKLSKELEIERHRLAACGVAALGYFNGCHDDYRSASLEDVLRLRERNRKLETALNDLLPGLILDLRYADPDDDRDALESRVKTVTDALSFESMTGAGHSYTGMKNVRELCAQAGIIEVETYYVSRTYLTRHGAGPLPGHDTGMVYEDTTNTPHPWQGTLRFAPLDAGLRARCAKDYGGDDFKLVLTHCDQREPDQLADLYSYGPTRANVRGWKDRAAKAN